MPLFICFVSTNGPNSRYLCIGMHISVESELKSKTKSIYLLILVVEAKPEPMISAQTIQRSTHKYIYDEADQSITDMPDMPEPVYRSTIRLYKPQLSLMQTYEYKQCQFCAISSDLPGIGVCSLQLVTSIDHANTWLTAESIL